MQVRNSLPANYDSNFVRRVASPPPPAPGCWPCDRPLQLPWRAGQPVDLGPVDQRNNPSQGNSAPRGAPCLYGAKIAAHCLARCCTSSARNGIMDGVGIATKKKMMSGKGRGGDGTVLVAATEARRISSFRTSSKLCALEPAESVVTAWN